MIWKRNRRIGSKAKWDVYKEHPVIEIRRLEGDWSDWFEYVRPKPPHFRIRRPLMEHLRLDDDIVWC